jgi:similar to stage IV sporulation protein
MKRLFFFLWGYAFFSVFPKDRVAVLNFLLKSGTVNRAERDKDGGMILFVLLRDKERLSNLSCEMRGEGGLPVFLKKAKRRQGLCVGAFLGLLLFILSSLVVWRVEVTGNQALSEGEIVSCLEEIGIGVGNLSKRVDTSKAKNALLLRYPELSFVSVYVRGTTVSIEVREGEALPEKPPKEEGYANQVAAYDAIVERVSVKAGRPAVAVGETVKAGDLLISGLYKSANGIRAVYAKGEILGRVGQKIEIKQPYTVQEKILDEEKKIGFSLLFFGKEIKVFKNGRNNTQSCDTINRVKCFSLFGDIRLPIGIRSTEETVYETEKLRYSEKEAMNLAYYKLSQRIDEELSDAQILKKSVSTYIDNDQYILECRMKCIENIGLIYEFDFEEIGQ